MRKFTLLTSVLLTAPFAVGNVSAQCVATQDCATLGYTETSCENGGIKCPFGNAWSCKNSSSNGQQYDPNCTYGSIYYNDGTCIKEFVSGRIPIGVVVYDDDITHEKWIMALDNAGVGNWLTEKTDIPEITNYTEIRTAASDLKSCENTEAMLAFGNDKSPAASIAKNYAPVGADNTKGKWCLPSLGIWYMINNHRTKIDAAISRASGTSFQNFRNYWSSSELDASLIWCWNSSGNFASSSKGNNTGEYYTSLVRPVMKI